MGRREGGEGEIEVEIEVEVVVEVVGKGEEDVMGISEASQRPMMGEREKRELWNSGEYTPTASGLNIGERMLVSIRKVYTAE